MEDKNTEKNSVAIIGSGFGGLAIACLMAKKGFDVTVYEKNEDLGGRARLIEKDGFRFDMGPSWYMMPKTFEHFFDLMEENIEDYYKLIQLNPSYRIKTQGDEKILDFKSGTKEKFDIFEELEPTSSIRLKKYLENAKKQYEISNEYFLYKNYNSLFDFINKKVMTEGYKLPLFTPVSKLISKYIFNPDLRHALEFQTVLLGTSPQKTPGIYSIMNHIDLDQGIFYPMGGLFEVTKALVEIAKKNGVKFKTNTEIKRVSIENKNIKNFYDQNDVEYSADIVISGADRYFTDHKILPKKFQGKSTKWWKKKIMTPSAFILYLGVDGKIKQLNHHNLILSKDWKASQKIVFEDGGLPKNPSLYICMPSHSDESVAPKNTENLFVLVPIKAGYFFSKEQEQKYAKYVINYIQKEFNIDDLKNKIKISKIYSSKDFFEDYNSYKGNALGGMAHTLFQTALGRPNNFHPKIKNLFYVGAGTNPGIGLPICLVSAENTYKRIMKIKDSSPLKKI